MRILLLQDDCSVGGHTFLRYENARALCRMGHDVHAFFFNDLGFAARFAEACPVTIGGAAALKNLLKREKFDAAHGDASMIDLPVLLKAARFQGRIVLTRHAVDSPVGWLRGDVDAYVAESPTSAALMQPYTDMTVDIVPNGIDVDLFKPIDCEKSSKPIIAWCGRSRASFKNVPLYLKTTANMDGGQYEFWVADGDDAKPVDGDVSLGPTGHVSKWRRYAREEFPLFYSQVAESGGCLLLTSLYEGLPLTVLEALACGCPVVAMDSRGVNDIMTGDLARWLYSTDASAGRVRDFVADSLPVLSTPRMRAALRKHIVDNYSVDVMANGNLAAYTGAKSVDHKISPRERKELASRLWEHASQTVERGGRPRDALFAMRGACRLDQGSLLRGDHLAMMLKAANQSRLTGARAYLAGLRTDEPSFNSGMRDVLRAARIHPGVLFDRRVQYGSHH